MSSEVVCYHRLRVCYRFFFSCYGDHRDRHVLTHSFPTRRSSDLQAAVAPCLHPCRHAIMDKGIHLLGFFGRSEEHTSELQSLMRISYAVFCLKKKNTFTPHSLIGNSNEDISS